MNARDYIGSVKCPMRYVIRLADALDRAPRPYTVNELAEITGLPSATVNAFLRCNKANEKVSCRYISRFSEGMGRGRPVLEYWRGLSGIMDTFKVDNMMDDKTEAKLKQGERPVSWRDNNHTSWSIDEADTVATMRGASVVRLGKLDGISYSKQGVTIRIRDTAKITFRRA